MKELKRFRAIKDGKIIGYTRLLQSKDPEGRSFIDYQFALIAEDYPDDKLFWETYGNHISHRPEIDSLDEYTGLKDKNGKEIYEGDIVKTTFHYCNDYGDSVGESKVQIMEVKWVEDKGGQFVGFRLFPSDDIYSLEIIGNVHENPEMLEKK